MTINRTTFNYPGNGATASPCAVTIGIAGPADISAFLGLVMGSMTRIGLCVLLLTTSARADDRVEKRAAPDAPASRHLIYVELLGKAGAYGVGYEYTLMPWLAFGAAASYAQLGDQHVTTGAPYIHATLLGHARNRMFGELGAIVAHSHIPSPVSDWTGMTSTGTAGFASLGYEHDRKRVVLRASGSIVAGDGGVGPMVGLSIGARP